MSTKKQLQEEIKRVNEIIKLYEDPMMYGAGIFAAVMMRVSVNKAENAIKNKDKKAMIISIQDLKEYEL
jgi:hypothetical protein